MTAMTFRKEKALSLQIDLNHMTQEELTDLEKVLNRIDVINELEANRIRRLKTTVFAPDHAKRSLSSINQKTIEKLQCRSCRSLCLPPNIVFAKDSKRTSILCRLCQMPVCHSCWNSTAEKKLKICTGCHKKIIIDAKTGSWFHQQMKNRLSIDQSCESPQMSGNSPKITALVNRSPKKKLLYRLRSYNSFHEEFDDMGENSNTQSVVLNTCKWPLPDQAEYLRKRSENSPSFYINSDLESEDEVKLNLNDEVMNSNKNYYRPLCHISSQPLKSCSNGTGAISVEEHSTDLCISSNNESSQANQINMSGGEVLIELDFNFRMSQFVIILRQCRNLPQVDKITNSVCPYLFVLLLPDQSKKSRRITSVKKNCLFPIFDQIFKYSINFTELESRSVLVMLCHKDDLSSRDLALGQVIIPLNFLDFSRPIVRWYSFQLLIEPNASQSKIERSFSTQTRHSNIPSYFGEISLAIKHVPRNSVNIVQSGQGELHVWVKSMKNVAPHQLNSATSVNSSRRFSVSDDKRDTDNRIMENISFGSNKILNTVTQLGQNQPVARVCLLPYRTSMQCTSPAKSQSNSNSQYVWSTILKFVNVDIEELRSRSLEVTIWVNSKHGWLNRIIPPRCIGGVRLCRGGRDCDSTSQHGSQLRGASTGVIEEKMWVAILDKHNTWIDGTIKLKMDSSFLNINLPDMQ